MQRQVAENSDCMIAGKTNKNWAYSGSAALNTTDHVGQAALWQQYAEAVADDAPSMQSLN